MKDFNEKLHKKELADEAQFEDAIDALRDAVIGNRLKNALSNAEVESSAVNEVLKYFHCKYKEQPLPPEIDTLEKQLDYRMRPFGIMYRPVNLDRGWYKHAVGIMIGTLKEDGSAVVLRPGKFGGYVMIDSRSIKRIRLNSKTEKLLDEDALCFYPPLPSKSLTVKDLTKFMTAQLSAADIFFYIGAMAATALLGLLSPMFTKWLFGTVLESQNLRVLAALACFMVGYAICSMCLSTFQSLVKTRISTKQDVVVQAAVLSRIVNLPPSFFRNYSSGELYYKTQSVQAICSTMFNTIGTTGLTSLFSIIYIVQIFDFAPALVVPSVLIILFSFVLTVLTSYIQAKHSELQLDASAKTSGLTYSVVKGIQKVKLAGAEKRMFSKWGKTYSKEAGLEYNPPVFLKMNGVINMIITLFGTLILYNTAIKSGVSVDNYYAFSSAYGLVGGAFTSLAGVATAAASILPMMKMAEPILKTCPENQEGKETVTQLYGKIEISNLCFRYEEGMPNVIENLNINVEPGEYLAIVGSTGCGKSTILRLLLGFETPSQGAIFYDRHNIQDIDLHSLRKLIGVVQQNSRLFPGSILSNITIVEPELTEEDAWKAAEIASVADDIREMPMGMHTVISEGQGGISGGQKQRILIARAIAPGPKILFFDEATSALDNITQKKISDAIDALNCTRIVIAHRLSTIKNADRILYFENGGIAEEGTYDELIAKNGKFAMLVERQRLET